MAGRGSNRYMRGDSNPRYPRGFYRPHRQPYPARFLEPQVTSTKADGDLPKNGPAQNGVAKGETRGRAEKQLLPKSVESKLASQALGKQSKNPKNESPGSLSVSPQAGGDLPKGGPGQNGSAKAETRGPSEKQLLPKSVESKLACQALDKQNKNPKNESPGSVSVSPQAGGDLPKGGPGQNGSAKAEIRGPAEKQLLPKSVESKLASQALVKQGKSPLAKSPGPVSAPKQPMKSADGENPKDGPAQKKSAPAETPGSTEKQVAKPVTAAENHAVAEKEGGQATESPTSSKIGVKPRGGGLASLSSNAGANNVRETMDLHVDCIPPNMTDQKLMDLFKTVGEVAECRMARKKSIMGIGKDHLGFAFVTYVQPSDAAKAIDVFDNHVVDGHTLKVSYAKPYGDASLNGNVFVKGFPKSWTTDHLRDLFSPYGEIAGARVLFDHETGISRGIGFIRYRNVGDAHRAVQELRSTYVQDEPRPLMVRLDLGPKRRNFAQRRNLMPNPYALMAPQLPMGGPPFVPQFPWHWLTNGTSLYVAGLPWQTTEKDVWALFGPFGAVQKVELIRDRVTGKNVGYAFVVMSRLHEAEAAMHLLHGSSFRGRRLTVAPKHVKKNQAPSPGMKPSGNGWQAGM